MHTVCWLFLKDAQVSGAGMVSFVWHLHGTVFFSFFFILTCDFIIVVFL